MPQVIIHYSDNIQMQNDWLTVLSRIHRQIAQIAGTDIMNCKGRAIQTDDYAVGDKKEDQAFLHLQISIFEGHDEAVLKTIGEKSLNLLKEITSANSECQFTVEIRTMSRDRYFKFHQTATR